MKKLFLTGIAALFLATGTAHAAEHGVMLPPSEYDHPYTGELLIIEVEKQQTLIDNCPGYHDIRAEAPNFPAMACAFGWGKRCVVLIASKDQIPWFQMIHKSYSYENILRHEIGHCNGWPGNHPNPVYDSAYDDR